MISSPSPVVDDVTIPCTNIIFITIQINQNIRQFFLVVRHCRTLPWLTERISTIHTKPWRIVEVRYAKGNITNIFDLCRRVY